MGRILQLKDLQALQRFTCTQVGPWQAGELRGYTVSPSTKQDLSTCSMNLLNSALGGGLHFNIPEPQNMHQVQQLSSCRF